MIMSRKFIYIPQGCYGIITPNTPNNVIGFVTAELSACCHVIVANSNGHIVLCHADTTTDLSSAEHGISSWIKRVCPNGDYTNLIINIGESPDNPRFTIEGELEKTARNSYYTRVVTALDSELGNHSCLIYTDNSGIYAISVLRENAMVTVREEYQKDLVITEVTAESNIEVESLIETEYDRELEGAIVSAKCLSEFCNALISAFIIINLSKRLYSPLFNKSV